jgi:hypothetical protein
MIAAAVSSGVMAEEVGTAPSSLGACPADATVFADPLSAPHWNGWGVDPSQRRFQSARMAQLAAENVPHLKLRGRAGAKISSHDFRLQPAKLFASTAMISNSFKEAPTK